MTLGDIVLIAEDDPQVAKLLRRQVEALGLVTLWATGLDEARALLKANPVRLVLLDRKLKDDRDSIGLCLELKKDPRTRVIPIIVLTGLEEFDEQLNSYRAGADLFLSKPFKAKELAQYIQAFLTRLPYKEESGSTVRCGAVTLDLNERSVHLEGAAGIELPSKQFDLLYLLVSRQGKLATRAWLVKKLWNDQVRDKEVDVLVSRLRDNLGAHASVIEPIRGQGYRLRTGSPSAPAA